MLRILNLFMHPLLSLTLVLMSFFHISLISLFPFRSFLSFQPVDQISSYSSNTLSEECEIYYSRCILSSHFNLSLIS
jgi:hypothetical protein